MCCCFACGKKKDAKKGKCGCGKFSCIKRVAKVYYGSSDSESEHKEIKDDPSRPNLNHNEQELVSDEKVGKAKKSKIIRSARKVK